MSEPCWCCSLCPPGSCVRLWAPAQPKTLPGWVSAAGAQLPLAPWVPASPASANASRATLTDTRTARAGKVMQIPSDFWTGWMFGETVSLNSHLRCFLGEPGKTTHHFVNHRHHCLLPHWEAVPNSGAAALFLDPVSVPACIFSYINYPTVWPWSLWYRKWSRARIFLTKRANLTPTI